MNDFTTIKTSALRIADLLKTELSKVSGLTSVGITLDSPSSLLSHGGGNLLSVFMYGVEVDKSFHNPIAPGSQSSTPPLVLKLRFLMTPIAKESGDVHLIINAVMEILDKNPILTLNNGSSTSQTIRLEPDALPHEAMMHLWTALGTPYRLSVAYIAKV